MTLMAKRDRRPSDPTVVASVDGGQTTAVPNTRPTDAVELAWSSGDVFGDQEIVGEEPQGAPANDRQSWSATLRIASLLVAGGVLLAGAIVLGRWVLTSEHSPTKAARPPEASTATPSATGAPISITSSPDQDNRFTQALTENG